MSSYNQTSTQVAGEDTDFFPASPASEYINSSHLSLCVIVVFESQIPINDTQTRTLLNNEFLPINPRFSSILVKTQKGKQQWKKVQVNVLDHLKVPQFPVGLEPNAYEQLFQEYLCKIAIEKLPEDRPLWEIHMFKYPIKEAAGVCVFKLHHALGDGFSLMGALFSCLKRVDDPSLPLTFPSSKTNQEANDPSRSRCCYRVFGVFKKVPICLWGCWNTSFDFGRSVLRSTVLEDDRNAIRSGTPAVELQPIQISTVSLSIDDMRDIKSKIGGTINDVAVGTIFYGIQLYKKRIDKNSRGKRMTALVLMNTRMLGANYQSIKEMMTQKTWGNHFTFLHVSIPCEGDVDKANPLKFVYKARKTIKRKRNSFAVVLMGKLIQILGSIKGPEAASRFIRSTMQNSSTAISHLIGPIEQIEVGQHPVKSFYFTVGGSPQSLALTMVSYMGNLRLSIAGEKGFIDTQLLASCVTEAFDKIYKKACGNKGEL